MANGIKGEVAVEYGGSTYTVALGFNAMATWETEADLPTSALKYIEEKGDRLSARDMRHFYWCGLREHHPDITIEDAGRILSAHPGSFMKAMVAAFPEADPDAAGKKPPPRVARK